MKKFLKFEISKILFYKKTKKLLGIKKIGNIRKNLKITLKWLKSKKNSKLIKL